ncbi:hypothetical protein Tco_0970844 [Tanacetum coccineum]
MYVSGHEDIFDMFDIDLFSVVALNMMVVKLGYTDKPDPLFYNYLRPLTSLDERLYALACEEDVCCLATIVRSFKLIKVYIEHGVTALDSYIRPPRFRATIEDITDEPGSIFNDINLSFVSQQATASHVIDDVMRQLSFEETKLDGEACFADVVRSGVESSGLSHDESFGVDDLDLNLNEPVNLNVSQIETQYEIHLYEEPYVGRTEEPIVAEVRTREPFVEESSKDAGTDDDDDEDEDFIVDEENEIVDPDVDVHLFVINMDIPFDNISVTNLVPDDVLEREDVDVINADGFDTDPGNNDETKNYRVNMEIPVKAIQDQLQRNLEVQISMSKAFRAKAKAEREIRGDHVLQYSMLREYVVELQFTNLNTIVKIAVERNTDPSLPTRGSFPGQVLAVVGLDLNNGIYPLVYALVEAESGNNAEASGLSPGQGGAGSSSGPGGAGVGSQGSSHTRWTKRRVQT